MDSPSQWTSQEIELIANCRVFEVHRHRMRRQSDSRMGEFYVLHAVDWVMALPLTPDNGLVLVKQFRFGTSNFSWEVPGGMVDPGEEPVETAVRELREETGYVGINPRLIGTASPNPAILNNRCHFVRIDGCELTQNTSPDENEEIETRIVSLEEAENWIAAGKIHHVIAIAAIFSLMQSLKSGPSAR
ncbi:MAG: NUDIX hydrolase [Puniceicoccaceae bacterium]